MPAKRCQHWVKILCLPAAVLAVASVAWSAPEPPGKPVHDLYKAGKPAEARELLIKMTDKAIEDTAKLDDKKDHFVPQTKLGFSVAVADVAYCFDLELKYGDGKIPVAMEQLSTRVLRAMERFALEGMSLGSNDPQRAARLADQLRFAHSSQGQLIVKVVRALQATGDAGRATAYIKEHDALIQSLGIPVARVLPTTQPIGSVPARMEVDGRALAAFRMIDKYYDALERKDVRALQACLTTDSKTAINILAEVDQEAKDEGIFDALGPVNYDAKTSLRITNDPANPKDFRVDLVDAIKSFRKGTAVLKQRESDHFQVQLTEDGYRIRIPVKR